MTRSCIFAKSEKLNFKASGIFATETATDFVVNCLHKIGFTNVVNDKTKKDFYMIKKEKAKDILIPLFYAMSINNLVKSFINRPRPFVQSDTIKCRDESILLKDQDGSLIYENGKYCIHPKTSSTSFPSGHSQNASSLYFSTASTFSKKWPYIIAGILSVFIMISRMALGVHFLTDVLAGFLIGLIIFLLYGLFKRRVKNEYLFHFIYLAILLTITLLEPLWTDQSRDQFTTTGTMIGAILGLFIESKYIDLNPSKSIFKNILRLLFALAIVIIFKIGLKYSYSWAFKEGTYISNIFDMIRYFLTLFGALCIAPYFIKKIKFLND